MAADSPLEDSIAPLPVLDTHTTRRVIGLLSEAHALRRYTEESELHRRELLIDA